MTERANSAASTVEGSRATRGEAAERLVVERLRAALGPDIPVLHHLRWLPRDRAGHDHEGEADVVIADQNQGSHDSCTSGRRGQRQHLVVIGWPAVLEAMG